MNRVSTGKATGVSQHYKAALKKHLAQGRRASLRSAAMLGRQAVAAGVKTSTLAKIHEQALLSLFSPGDSHKQFDGKVTRADAFFLEVLRPFEHIRHEAAEKQGRESGLKGKKRQRTVELAELRRRLERESLRRKMLAAALRRSERHYRQLLARSRRVQEHLRRLSHEILIAQEQERKRISRELHDEIGQTLTAINMKLATLKREATVTASGFRKAINGTQRLLKSSMNTVHQFARDLRPPLLDDLGLIPALHAHLKAFTRRMGIPVRFSTFAAVEQLDSDKRMVLYRVAQEAFLNVARHARASLASLRIERDKDLVRMEIHDNGRSFNVRRVLAARKPVRLGVLGMRERVEMVGGSFNVESEPGKGTTILVEVPFGRRTNPSAPRNRVPKK